LQVKKAAERMAINTPLQGTAADIIKVAMINISRMLSKFKTNNNELNVKMLLQVHDELLFEIRDDKVEKAAQEIKKIMEEVLKLKVPVEVDVEAGENWGEMKSISN
jgi:DNA polymerase-1